MKVPVRGGTGFVGSHYVRTLVAGGYPGWAGTSVTVLGKLTRPALPARVALTPPDRPAVPAHQETANS